MKELIEKLEKLKEIDLAKNQVKVILSKEEINYLLQALSQSEGELIEYCEIHLKEKIITQKFCPICEAFN